MKRLSSAFLLSSLDVCVVNIYTDRYNEWPCGESVTMCYIHSSSWNNDGWDELNKLKQTHRKMCWNLTWPVNITMLRPNWKNKRQNADKGYTSDICTRITLYWEFQSLNVHQSLSLDLNCKQAQLTLLVAAIHVLSCVINMFAFRQIIIPALFCEWWLFMWNSAGQDVALKLTSEALS